MLTISPEEQAIIQAVRVQGQVSLPELARQLNVHRSSLYYQLQILVKKGVLEDRKVTARRSVYAVAKTERLQAVIAAQQRELASLLLDTPRLHIGGRWPKLVFSDAYVLPAELLAKLRDYEVVTHADSPVRISPEAFVLRCHDADVAVTFFSVKITRAMLLECPRLKCIVTASISNEMIDVAACQELGIQVKTLSSYDNYKRAARVEFVFASLFNLLRPVRPQAEALRLGRFDYRGYTAEELRGKTVGVVGVNREGRDIIPLLRAFGCGVEVCNPDNVAVAPSDVGVAGYAPLADLFASCDVVIFPEDYATTIALGPALLREGMRTQYLLCLSYSLRLDLDQLRELIVSQQILGLAIDYFADVVHVWDHVPESDYRKVMNFPNVVVTPELGFYTVQAMARNYQQVFDILCDLKLEVTA